MAALSLQLQPMIGIVPSRPPERLSLTVEAGEEEEEEEYLQAKEKGQVVRTV